MNKTIEYLKEVKAEAKNVTWPTKQQTMYFTLAVLIVSAFIAYYLGLFDKIFSIGLGYLLNR